MNIKKKKKLIILELEEIIEWDKLKKKKNRFNLSDRREHSRSNVSSMQKRVGRILKI